MWLSSKIVNLRGREREREKKRERRGRERLQMLYMIPEEAWMGVLGVTGFVIFIRSHTNHTPSPGMNEKAK